MDRKLMRLGEILLSDGVIRDWQLQAALDEQKKSGCILGEALIKKGYLTEAQLLKVLSEQYNIPVKTLDLSQIDWSAARAHPVLAMPGSKCFPVALDEVAFTVAISDPLDLEVIKTIEMHVNDLAVKLVLVKRSEIQAAIKMFQTL